MRAAPGSDQSPPPGSSQATATALSMSPHEQTARSPAQDNPTCISSERLFAGAQEVQISHQGMRYRLKKTALGKLILTK